MTLESRHVSIESGVQVITVIDFITRRHLDAHIPASVNRVAVKIVIRLKIMPRYEAQIPPRFNRVAFKSASRFKIMAEYDAQIPPVVSRVKCPGHHRESL